MNRPIRPEHNHTGQRFGRLLVIRPISAPAGMTGQFWFCRCDCGNTHSVRGGDLRRKKDTTFSCGCYRRDRGGRLNRSHGMTGTPEYRTWLGVLKRCNCPDAPGYQHYGGRGIRVCERWASFDCFFQDMGPRPSDDHSIERRDVNGHYEPANCTWATITEQSRNKRDTIWLELNGTRRCLREWAEILGIHPTTLLARLRHGWSAERALTTPVNVRKRNRRAKDGCHRKVVAEMAVRRFGCALEHLRPGEPLG